MISERLNVILSLTDRLTRPLRDIQSNLSGFDVMAGIGLGVGAAGFVVQAAQFEAQMSKVGAVSRATDDELVQLKDTAEQLGKTTQFSALEAAQGLEFLAMAGFDAQSQMAALPGV